MFIPSTRRCQLLERFSRDYSVLASGLSYLSIYKLTNDRNSYLQAVSIARRWNDDWIRLRQLAWIRSELDLN